jgi:hypothetical protein
LFLGVLMPRHSKQGGGNRIPPEFGCLCQGFLNDNGQQTPVLCPQCPQGMGCHAPVGLDMPILEPGMYVHCCRGNQCPPSVKVSHKSGVGGIGCSWQEATCRRRKERLKRLRKQALSVAKCGSTGLNKGDATSAGQLSFLAQWTKQQH